MVAMLPLILILIPMNPNSIGAVKVLMVQGDVPELGLDFNSRAKTVFLNHVNETKLALAKDGNVDFILWPENAVDVDPFTNNDVKGILNSFTVPLIIGAVTREGGNLQNVSILWQKTLQEIYVKQHLTPFGEYIPLRSLASKISPLVNSVEDFSPGISPKIFAIGSAKIAPIICFELIDDRILNTAAQASNLLVVQTKSATFGFSPESAQQLEISRIRAIEHGRNLLSVSTTGISAVIDSTGEISARTDIHEPAHLFATVQLLDSQTPRDRAGHWSTVAAFIWLLIVARTGRKVVS
jgi:apolipoprotein N-acyltransferase